MLDLGQCHRTRSTPTRSLLMIDTTHDAQSAHRAYRLIQVAEDGEAHAADSFTGSAARLNDELIAGPSRTARYPSRLNSAPTQRLNVGLEHGHRLALAGLHGSAWWTVGRLDSLLRQTRSTPASHVAAGKPRSHVAPLHAGGSSGTQPTHPASPADQHAGPGPGVRDRHRPRAATAGSGYIAQPGWSALPASPTPTAELASGGCFACRTPIPRPGPSHRIPQRWHSARRLAPSCLTSATNSARRSLPTPRSANGSSRSSISPPDASSIAPNRPTSCLRAAHQGEATGTGEDGGKRREG